MFLTSLGVTVAGRYEHHDVVVVGAGFAGLSAAHALTDAGLSVQLLEARSRVGGRALTRYLDDGTQLDLGGQWIGPTQLRINEIVQRYGVEIYRTPAHGAAVNDFDGDRREDLLPDVTELFDSLEAMCRRVPAESPWEAEEARQWDRMTFASWLDATGRPDVATRYVARVVSGGLLAGSPAETSVLETLFYLVSAGGVQSLLGYEGGAQESRVVGGAQVIADRMAADLPEGVLRLGEPVLRIEYSDDGARVESTVHAYRADRVVVAVPPVIASRLRYDPPLPPLKDGALQRVPAGTALKVHAVYAEPFWREAGYSGISTSAGGLLTETVDNTPPGAPRAVLTAFAYGDEAVELRRHGADARRASVLERLAELFGAPALSPEDFVEYDWLAQEWTRGCFSGHLTTGAGTTFGSVLRTPVGVVHWAGTETATEWNGYFDGAVASGRRAADEVVRALRP